MNERTLLASVVLFQELYDKDKDVYDVIAEFIKAAMVFASKWTVDATIVAQLLSREFGLSIPEAVYATTMRNRLYKRDGVLSYDRGRFTSDISRLSGSLNLVAELKKVQTKQNDLFDKLRIYVEKRKGRLSEQQVRQLESCLCGYLSSENLTTKYSEDISSFIIQYQDTDGFKVQLNSVREGFVLYDGVCHTPDLGTLGSWKHKLDVYLDTEHLFNVAGLNGELQQKLFKDFYGLASDVRVKGKRLISVGYFLETKGEVERFFSAAEHILKGNLTLDPSKQAMISILDGCKSPSDILHKKAKFYAALDSFGIVEKEVPEAVLAAAFNLESLSLQEETKKEFKKRGREFSEDKFSNLLKMFSKINGLRNGVSSTAFENIGHIFVAGSYLANYLAFHPDVRNNSNDIPVATDLEFLTNRLWFKLQKGLAKGSSRPSSLNVLAKAQIVLSSQINNSVSEKFDQVQSDYKSGALDKEKAEYLFHELRMKAVTPENITAKSVLTVLEFLDHKDYHDHLREKSHQEEQIRKGNDAIRELEELKERDKDKKRRFVSFLSLVAHGVITVGLVGIIVFVYYLCIKFILNLATENDTTLTIVGVVAALILPTISLWKYQVAIRWLKSSHNRLVDAYVK